MERTNSGINVWFWTRNESNAPLDVCSGSSSIDTSNWVSDVAIFFFTLQLCIREPQWLFSLARLATYRPLSDHITSSSIVSRSDFLNMTVSDAFSQ